MLISAALVPTLGYAPTGVRPGHDDELRKRITTSEFNFVRDNEVRGQRVPARGSRI